MNFLASRSLVLVSGLALVFAEGCGSADTSDGAPGPDSKAAALVEPATPDADGDAATAAPVVEVPVVEEPVVQEPVVEEPVVEEPVVEKPAAPSVDRVELVRTFTKGDLRRFKLVETEANDINMGMQGSIMSTRSSSTEWSFEVLDVDATGKATLEVKVGRVHGAIENPMLGEIKFDSESESEGSGNPMLDGMVKMFTVLGGKTFRATLGSEGELSGFQGLQDVIDEANAGMGGMGMGMGMGGGGGLTAAAVTQSLNQALIEVPAGFHMVGDAWDRETAGAAAMGGTSTVKVKAVLKEIGPTEVTIETLGKVEVNPPSDADDDASGDMQAAMMRNMMKNMKMVDSSVTGTVRVGRNDGLVVSRRSETSFTIELPSPMGGDEKLVVTTKNTSELSRVTAE